MFIETLNKCLDEALNTVRSEKLSIYTLAFYHDHESSAVSVCVDTRESSTKCVLDGNRFWSTYFWDAHAVGDLSELQTIKMTTGRSLALGDYALVDVARHDLPKKASKQLYLDMMSVLRQRQKEVLELSDSPNEVMFVCSGPKFEAEFCWGPSE